VYEKLCEYFDKAIAKVLLGQTLTSEPGRVGSYNLGKIHDDVRRDILEADGDSMCEYLNRTLVRWVVDYNFSGVGVNEYPRVWRNTENPPDLFELAQRDKILFVDMGLSDRVPTKYIEDTYHVPLAAGGERVIGRVAAPVTPSGPMGRGSVKTRRGPGVTEGDDDDEESHGGAFAEPEGEEDDEDAAMLAMLAYIDHVTMRAADMAACAVHNAVGWLRMVDQAGAMRVMGVSSLGMAAKLVSGIEDMLLESARVGYGGEAVGWGGLPGEAGARALTVARLTDESILSDIKAMVERALVEGWSGDQFRARAREVLGEWYAAPGEPIWETMPDGTTRKRVAGWRLDTIYRTNAQCVFSAGRYRRLMADVRGREYWQYRGVLDERTRETHAAMFYKVYPREHPVWEIWYPPNGFNCRCYVVGLTRADIDAGEWRVSQDMPTVVPDEGWAYNFGRVSMESWEGGHAVQEG
jgi:SPP1 gp7 family putative phage head morphogenesis protein